MSFGSVEFLLLFVPVGWLLYALGPRRLGWQNGLVIAWSYLFYLSWTPKLFAILLLSTVVNWGAGLGYGRLAGDPRARRLLFWAAIAFNAGMLLGFKYLGFFARSLGSLLGAAGVEVSMPALEFALPLGISFWTLQLLAYQIDVYLGRFEATRSLSVFAAFVAFFPQVVSGPIPRPHQLLPQLEAPRRVTPGLVASGVATFFVGFALKFLLADSLGAYLVGPGLAAPEAYSTLSAWASIVGYAIQIFGDFAGYSVMAIGVGRLFAIELPINFNVPFFSTDMMEFWRRWHITLNAWLFDYLYGPLMTSRGWLRGRYDLGFIVVFAVSGLWHGATWPFVLWGMLHGVGLAVHRRWDQHYRSLCRKDRKWVARRKTRAYRAGAWFVTQAFFVLTLVPFRAADLDELGRLLGALLGSAGTGFALAGGGLEALAVAAALGFLVVYHAAATARGKQWMDRFLAAPAPIRGVVYGAFAVALILLTPVGTGNFIYAQF
jgi:D-alanyl-lipoteichoic acid acyltransferase DltB (MBOAT superfamily)